MEDTDGASGMTDGGCVVQAAVVHIGGGTWVVAGQYISTFSLKKIVATVLELHGKHHKNITSIHALVFTP
jgi:hypothetical protein